MRSPQTVNLSLAIVIPQSLPPPPLHPGWLFTNLCILCIYLIKRWGWGTVGQKNLIHSCEGQWDPYITPRGPKFWDKYTT